MKRWFVALLAVAGVAIGAVGCEDEGSATGSTCPPTQTLTYANFGKPFMDKYCVSCHSGDEAPNLSSQANVQAHREAVDKAAAAGPSAANSYMPEGGNKPSDDERKKLGEWLACGAPLGDGVTG